MGLVFGPGFTAQNLYGTEAKHFDTLHYIIHERNGLFWDHSQTLFDS